MLATLSMKLDVAQGLHSKDPARAKELVAEVQAEMKETLALVRRLVYTLYPPVLDELGLPTALREQASSQLQAHGVAVEVATYYISVEAMINIRRHARVTRCQLKLRIDPNRLTIEITDDGRGIPAGTRPGAGLHSMRERAEEVRGSLDMTTASPHGTRIRAELPVTQENR
jgi:signal transduction histidine kinase